MKLIYTTQENLKENLNNKDKEEIELSFDKGLSIEDLSKQVKEVLDIEKDFIGYPLYLRLKDFSFEHKVRIMKDALNNADLNDIILTLNIINLIKCSNDLPDEYFQDDNIIFNSIVEILDLSIELEEDLTKIRRDVSVAFMSLFKSYHKFEYADTEKHIQLNNLIRNILLTCDLLTLSTMFSVSDDINSSELYYVDNAMFLIQNILYKNSIFKDMSQEILKDTAFEDFIKVGG